jgi:ADP-ribosyl-[dinitrogen reductase] hydrolase
MNEFDIGLGIIAGAAVGDALGAPLEFLPPRSPDNFVTEMTGGGVLKWKPGEITDDTTMALAIMEMYLEKKGYHQATVLEKWGAWKSLNPKDMGNWTYKVLGKWGQYRDRSRVLRGDNNPAVMLWKQTGAKSAGNGAVMRCMSTAVVQRNSAQKLLNETIWLAEDTHPDPRCILSCVVVNNLLSLGFEGVSKQEALIRTKQTLAELTDLTQVDLWDALESCPHHKWENWQNKGYTVDTVKCALAAWYQNDDFEEGLVKVVNRGNDADTVGAVAGALLGAYHGFKTIPQRWWDALGQDVKERLTNNTRGLLEIGASK